MNNYLSRFLLMFSIVLWSSNVTAKIYECVMNGVTVYQLTPCQTDIREKSNAAALTRDFAIFDGWVFGDTINAVKRLARNRQLPMSPGTSSYLSSYNEKILNTKPKERRYSYKTKLFGKFTTVTLFFTKLSKQLYKIEATLHVMKLKPEERKYFYESLYSQLTDKYGKATNVRKSQNNNGSVLGSISDLLTRNITETLIGSNLVWAISANSQVSLNYKKNYQVMSSYKLVYTNKAFARRHDAETSRAIRNRTDRAISQDRNRF